jgi:pyridoxine 5-phosphate synthase
MNGADGITVHLREDRRHISDRDVRMLRETVKTHLNLEMATWEEIIEIACMVKPDQATLVPERREEVTTEGGLDVAGSTNIEAVIGRLRDNGIFVSLFIDPTSKQVAASAAVGAQAVELHTGIYCNARGSAREKALADLVLASRQAAGKGLAVIAGHGLDYHNIGPVAAIPELEEVNIGFAIIARALFTGLGAAVGEMRELLDKFEPPGKPIKCV